MLSAAFAVRVRLRPLFRGSDGAVDFFCFLRLLLGRGGAGEGRSAARHAERGDLAGERERRGDGGVDAADGVQESG
jgi:hypothetical protein